MITFFSIPKPFTNHIGIIQRNAIRSWTLLKPESEILLMGNEPGTAQVAEELGVRQIREIAINEYGTPLIHDLFEKAQKLAKHDLICYINADIILLSDFLRAVNQIQLPEYLLVGRRWDMDITQSLNFQKTDWETELRAQLQTDGVLHAHTGIDFFVFRRGLYKDLPPFAVGRTTWDNWLIYKARSLKVPVIDATDQVTIVHQNHQYNHHPEGMKWIWNGPEAKNNLALAGGPQRAFTVIDANYTLTAEGLKKPSLTKARLRRKLEVLPVLSPKLGPVMKVINRLTTRFLA
jgi:hypothetical protein